MTDQAVPFRVDDALFEELRGFWARWVNTKNPTSEIIVQLRRKFKITDAMPLGQMVFYGKTRGSEINECLIGRLIAVAPGLVLVDTYDSDLFYPLSGIFERSGPSEAEFFKARCFASRPLSLGLWIRPSVFPQNQPRFTDCPVWIDIQTGAGHAEGYAALGVDPGRWEIMRAWLDVCLPSKNSHRRD